MPPKRAHQNSAPPDDTAKRPRIADAEASTELSPMSELGDLPAVTAGGSSESQHNESSASFVTNTARADATDVHNNTADVHPNEGVTGVKEQAVDSGLSAKAPPSVNEATAVHILKQLGVEPGALVNADGNTLGAIISSLLQNKADALAAADTGDVGSCAAPTAGAGAEPLNVQARDDTTATATAAEPVAAQVTAADFPPESAPALAGLMALGVPANRVVGWTSAEMRRLDTLLKWTDPARHIYNITTAPNKKDWGQPAAFNDTSNTLCLEGTAKPLTFWITGEVSVQYWFDNEGFPAQRPAFAIQPMVENQSPFCKSLLHELCMPTNSSKVAEQMGPGQVKASRWMNERAKKGQPAKTHEFKAVYDARNTLRDKSLLQQLNVGQLQIHDIVVMEVRINRYALKEEGAADTKGKRRAMDRWQAYFDLQAVYKIKDAMDTPEVLSPAADFSI